VPAGIVAAPAAPATRRMPGLFRVEGSANLAAMVLVEICVDEPAGARVAARHGAGRLEVCGDLGCGGITPSPGLMTVVREAVDVPLVALIRARPGDFVYRDEEVRAMIVDIGVARDCGMQGVAVGCLDGTGRLHREQMAALAAAAAGLELICHRAFDLCADLEEALADLVDLGFHRVLTSGGQRSALDGVSILASLVERAGDAITILPGGGIRSVNVGTLLAGTGAREVHASASGWREPVRRPSDPRIGNRDDDPIRITDADEVLALVNAARQ